MTRSRLPSIIQRSGGAENRAHSAIDRMGWSLAVVRLDASLVLNARTDAQELLRGTVPQCPVAPVGPTLLEA